MQRDERPFGITEGERGDLPGRKRADRASNCCFLERHRRRRRHVSVWEYICALFDVRRLGEEETL